MANAPKAKTLIPYVRCETLKSFLTIQFVSGLTVVGVDVCFASN